MHPTSGSQGFPELANPSEDLWMQLPRLFARQSPGAPIDVRRAVLQFLLAGLVALLVIATIALLALRRESREEAIRDSANYTRLLAETVVAPTLAESPDLLDGNTEALAAFDQRIRRRVLESESGIVRVKIWRADGHIVYSDLTDLIGQRFDLDPDELDVLRSGSVHAEISDLDKPENAGERLQGKLLEVYYPIRAPSGELLLVEAYQRFAAVSSGGSAVLRKFLPIFLLSLIVLSLVQAPLAWSMARRLRESQRERERLLVSAIDASDTERRRIASAVHDGPVQELAGLSFALAGAADRVNGTPPPDLQRSLEDAAKATRGIMRQLRGMLVEIHPPNLHAAGLEAALSDLLAPLPARGIETNLDVVHIPEMEREVETLLFRGAQEALRNVVKHSQASHVVVTLTRQNGAARLEVRDDGKGSDDTLRELRRAEGHMGLSLLTDLVTHAGGRVTFESEPNQGTRLEIEVPLR